MDNISSMSDETLLTNYTKLKVEIDKRKEAAKAFLDQYDDITKPKVLLNLPSLDITDIQYYILTKIAYCIFKDVVETQTSCHVEHLWENRVRVVFRDPKDKQKLKNALKTYDKYYYQVGNPEWDETTLLYTMIDTHHLLRWDLLAKAANCKLTVKDNAVKIVGSFLDIQRFNRKIGNQDYTLISSQVPPYVCYYYRLISNTNVDVLKRIEVITKTNKCTLSIHRTDKRLISIYGAYNNMANILLYMEEFIAEKRCEVYDYDREYFVRPCVNGILRIEGYVPLNSNTHSQLKAIEFFLYGYLTSERPSVNICIMSKNNTTMYQITVMSLIGKHDVAKLEKDLIENAKIINGVDLNVVEEFTRT